MENKQAQSKVATGKVMYIRGVPFRCPTPAVAARENGDGALSSPPALRPSSATVASAAVPGDVAAFAPNGFAGADRFRPGRAMAAAGRCGLMGCASRSQAAFMKSRRSVRVFADKAVSMRVLRDLVAAASRAEPAEASVSARFVMVESAPAMDRASELAAAWLRREGILADGLGPEARAREVVFGGAPHMAVAYGPRDDAGAASACALAVARMEWLAVGAGLGVCFAGEMVQAAAACPELAAALSIPGSAVAQAAVFIGYPGSRTAPEAVIPGTRIIWL